MAKSKAKSKEELSAELIPFLTDLAARQKGVRTWNTLGTAGNEPVGGLRGTAGYIANKAAEENGLKLQKGEINPFIFSDSMQEGGKPSKQMYEYWASDAMPTLPKAMRKQYDVVFAGTRPFDPSEEVYNTKFGYNLADKTENIWQFVPRQTEQISQKVKEKPAIPSVLSEEVDGDRPVQVGTLTYIDPTRERAGQEFLTQFVRSTGMPSTTV